MRRSSEWFLVLAAVLVLVGGAVAAARTVGSSAREVKPGSVAPDMTVLTLDDPPEEVRLGRYRGQVVLLNIWATWCGPCRVEMPSIVNLYRDFGPKGLKVVAVATDDPGQEPAIRGFVREYGLTFDVLHEGTGHIEQLFQTTGSPETVIIGKDGVIRKKVVGATRWDSPANRALIAQLLSEP